MSSPDSVLLSFKILFSGRISQFSILTFLFPLTIIFLKSSFLLNLFFFHSILFLSYGCNVFFNLSKDVSVSIKTYVLHIISFYLGISISCLFVLVRISHIRHLFKCMGVLGFLFTFQSKASTVPVFLIYIVMKSAVS